MRIANEQRVRELEISLQQETLRKQKEAQELAERNRLQEIENKRIAEDREVLRKVAERLAAIELENKRIQEEKEAQEALRIEQEKEAALAPDKEKLMTFCEALGNVKCLPLSNPESDKLYQEALGLVAKIQAHVQKGIKLLTKQQVLL